MTTFLYRRRLMELGILFLVLLVVGRLSISPGNIRVLIFASLFIITLAMLAIVRERIIFFLIVYLSFMGLIRRALIPIASWSSFDPLLILGPSITIILALSLFWELKSQQNLGEEKPDKLMVALFIFGCVQMFNPYSGSPISGFVAAIYIIVPWLWYFIAFYKIKQKDIVRILNIVEVIGTLIALYGIYQTFFGILPFEQMWVDLTGYAALYLAEDTVRAIGTFPSAQEFVYFTMITFMIGFTKLILKKNCLIHLPVVLITLLSIFFASSRTVIFFMAIALIMILIVSKKTLLQKIVTGLISIMVLFSIWSLLPRLNPSWFGVAEPAVQHMIEGLVDPLSEEQTGLGHIERIVEGMKTIATNPIGHGIASVTKAADKSGGKDAMSTEMDLSNMIVALGIGGVIYILVVIMTMYKLIKLISRQRKIEYIMVLGILAGGIGNWVNGGFYTTSILTWLLVGWIHKQYSSYRGEVHAYSSH
ncbi:hypothetical protein [Niallia circulans]|uniref:hypothetical protein n=1 Tax=Niallia circulans TaxID=1397 RepID=UPI00201E10DF|nr:hypothetical protein [Niallia circulans]